MVLEVVTRTAGRSIHSYNRSALVPGQFRRIDVIRRDAGGTGAERLGAGSLERRPAAGVVCRGLQGGSYRAIHPRNVLVSGR